MAPSSAPIQPLNVGNVVSAGFQLYRSHSKDYLLIALFATLWALLPFVAVIAVVVFFAVVQNYFALLALLIPALIVLFLFCYAKYLSEAGLISRLAYGELTNQPETLRDARRFTNSRKWSFLLAGFLVSLIFFGIFFIFYLAVVILAVTIFASIGGLSLLQNPDPSALAANAGAFVVAILVFLALLLVFLAFILWFSARFSAVELPVAVEPGTSASGAIGRIWSLTKGNAWRIAAVLFITFLVTLPLQILVQVLSSAADVIISRVAGISPESEAYTALSTLFAYVIGFLLSIIVLPLWQTVKSVIYYDLRSRREGLGLQLRDR